MRVGIDYFPATTHAPGVGRYARELVRALVRVEGAPALRLLEFGRGRRAVPDASLGLAGVRADVSRRRVLLPRGLFAPLAAVGIGADRLAGAVDVFHHVLPFDPPPVSAALQTLALSDLPPAESAAESALRATLRRMDRVLVFSAAARDVVVARFGVARDAVRCVPVGADHWAREGPVAGDAGPARREPPEAIVLGQASPRRRPLAIVRALEILAAGGSGLRLRFLGPKGQPAEDLRRALADSPARDRVAVESGTESEMPGVVSGAALLVHLNDAEWTAVTPLEAFAAGCPVVASRLPAFEEALGDRVDYVDNEALDADAGVLARAMEDALASDAPEARAARRARAAGFTWDANARATIRAWRELS